MTLEISERDGLMSLHVSSIGRYAESVRLIPFDGFIVSTVTPTPNLAVFHPVKLPFWSTIARFFTVNGNATGNVDVGIYTHDFTLITSTGSTAKAGASTCQYLDVTNKIIPPGRYWLAAVFTAGTTNALAPTSYFEVFNTGVVHQQLASGTLPATATPHQLTNPEGFYYIGYTQSDTL